MKKFLFRGRRLDNAEWVEGSLIVYNEDVYCIAVKTDFPEELEQFRVDPDTVCRLDEKTQEKPCSWISVEDRLPMLGERVLFAGGCFVGEGYLDNRDVWNRYYGGSVFDILGVCVTHWMPLPEPPEIGGDEND